MEDGARDPGEALHASDEPRMKTGGRVLFRGARIVSMDPEVGASAATCWSRAKYRGGRGRPLRRRPRRPGGRRRRVGDGDDPGSVDGHRDRWQATPPHHHRHHMDEYITLMHGTALAYEPRQPTPAPCRRRRGRSTPRQLVLDLAHNARSPEHQNRAVAAWRDSGSAPSSPLTLRCSASGTRRVRDDVTRLRNDQSALDDGLMTLGLESHRK